jgi:hypothetical protein
MNKVGIIIVVESIFLFFFILELHLKGSGIISKGNFKFLGLLLFDYFKARIFLLGRLLIAFLLRDDRILFQNFIFIIFFV